MPYLTESQDSYIVNVNSYPYLRKEQKIGHNNKERIIYYGRDNNREKINKVIYPKKYYTKKYIMDNIMYRYKSCPVCNFGRNIKSSKNDSDIPIIFVGIATVIPIILLGLKYFIGRNIES